MGTDLTKITDIKELKALAYDFLVQKQTVDQNLNLVNQRLAQLQREKATPKIKKN